MKIFSPILPQNEMANLSYLELLKQKPEDAFLICAGTGYEP